MTNREQKRAREIISRIQKRLDWSEELISWFVRADARFRKGQRVKFSPIADRKGISRAKHGVRRGKVLEVNAGNNFLIKVLLDGYKRPDYYHHMFFDPIR